jgi:hypothetical protein
MTDDSGIFTTTGRILFLQQLKRNFWKCPRWDVLSLYLSTGPSKLFKFPEIVSRLSSLGGTSKTWKFQRHSETMMKWSRVCRLWRHYPPDPVSILGGTNYGMCHSGSCDPTTQINFHPIPFGGFSGSNPRVVPFLQVVNPSSSRSNKHSFYKGSIPLLS